MASIAYGALDLCERKAGYGVVDVAVIGFEAESFLDQGLEVVVIDDG